jgi:NADPH-dependent ferric siderophore reductase
MADRPKREKRQLHRTTVVRTERLTPHMIRVVVGGPVVAELPIGEHTDHYVKLTFPKAGVDYPRPMDMDVVRRDLPREQWPVTRSYTVRRVDRQAQELTIDFVHHGDEGYAGPWAANAKPGDELLFMGPGGGYAPDPDADWHLLVGDESALPAIATALERLPAGAKARVFIEVAGPDEEQKLTTAADASVVWVHRGGRPYGAGLVEAVRGLASAGGGLPEGRLHAFVHGEAGFVRDLRRLLRIEHSLPAEQLSISGYWRRGFDDEGWRAQKADWNQRIADEESRAEAT